MTMSMIFDHQRMADLLPHEEESSGWFTGSDFITEAQINATESQEILAEVLSKQNEILEELLELLGEQLFDELNTLDGLLKCGRHTQMTLTNMGLKNDFTSEFSGRLAYMFGCTCIGGWT